VEEVAFANIIGNEADAKIVEGLVFVSMVDKKLHANSVKSVSIKSKLWTVEIVKKLKQLK
jgi:hypothetical protein